MLRSSPRDPVAADGGKGSLEDVRPKDDADGDGLSSRPEYLAGTYAFDPQAGFSLTIRSVQQGWVELEFMAIRGHQYTAESPADLVNWIPVPFDIAGDGALALAGERESYDATDVRLVRVTVGPAPESVEPPRFFRIMVR